MANTPVYEADKIRSVRELHSDLLTPDARTCPISEWLDQQAQRIAAAHSTGNTTASVHITCWHPALVGRLSDEILAAGFSIDDARETIAREYGFVDWAAASAATEPPNPEFERAVDALLSGNASELSNLLHDRPNLVAEQSAFGHRATLLHYVGSNGVETWRQVVPLNLAELTQLLIDAGADVNATANMYGGSTTLGLLLSSAHPAAAGVTNDVADVLRAAGATA